MFTKITKPMLIAINHDYNNLILEEHIKRQKIATLLFQLAQRPSKYDNKRALTTFIWRPPKANCIAVTFSISSKLCDLLRSSRIMKESLSLELATYMQFGLKLVYWPLAMQWLSLAIFVLAALCTEIRGFRTLANMFMVALATSFPGSSLYLEKVPWLRLVKCLCIQIKSAQGVDH